MKKIIFFINLILIPTLVIAQFGGSFTHKKIDRIGTNTESVITLEDGVKLDALVLDTVPFLNGSKILESSTISQLELERLEGINSNVQTQLDAKLDDYISSNDNRIIRSDGATGEAVQDSLIIIDDVGAISGLTKLNNDNIQLDGNTIETTDLNGDLVLKTNVGSVQLPDLTASKPLKLNALNYIISAAIDLVNDITGILGIGSGGTNSSSALANNLVMESNAGSIVESLTTSTELSYLNSVTSDIQNQIDSKEPNITTLPISKGGTNSSTPLLNDKVIVSNLGSLIESSTTTISLGYLDATSSIQNQLDGKEPNLSKGNLTETTSSVLTITSGTNSVIGTGTSLEVQQATTSTGGYLSSTDWNTFNDKVATVNGTANEIEITTGTTIGLADNAILPGTDAFIPPKGTTAQRGANGPGKFRFNSELDTFEGFTTANNWGPIGGLVDFLNVDSDITPDTTGTRNVGTSGKPWGSIASLSYNLMNKGQIDYVGLSEKIQIKTNNEDGPDSTGLTLETGTASTTGESGKINLLTGNVLSGTGDSGDINIITGSSTGGNSGNIIMREGGAFAPGDVWTAKDIFGAGNWVTPPDPTIVTAKGNLLTHNGTNQTEFPACPNDFYIQWDDTDAFGFKCKPSATADITVVGQVISSASQIAPEGFLLCDGSAISRTSYSDLFNKIGTAYGVGDGSTTFNVPNFQGEFLRGNDNGRGVDTGRIFGSSQLDDFKSHNHPHTVRGNQDGDAGNIATGSAGYGPFVRDDSSIGNRGSNETRPRNVSVNYYIRFSPAQGLSSGVPLMAKGSIFTSDGNDNGEFTACLDTEILIFNSSEPSGLECGTPAASGANTSLSNLSNPTAVSQNLLPDAPLPANSWYAIGDLNHAWREVVARQYHIPDNNGALIGRLQNNGGGQVLLESMGSGTAQTKSVKIRTGNQTGTSNTGQLTLESGDSSGASSGHVVIETGSAVTRGDIYLKDGSEGVVGDVWTSIGTTGQGNWATPAGGGGANDTLSNLASPTSVNQNLIPSGAGQSLGSSTTNWAGVHANAIDSNTTNLSLKAGPGTLVMNVGVNGVLNYKEMYALDGFLNLSTTKASISAPVMTEAQRDLATYSTTIGAQVFNSTTDALNIRGSGGWIELGGGGGGGATAFDHVNVGDTIDILGGGITWATTTVSILATGTNPILASYRGGILEAQISGGVASTEHYTSCKVWYKYDDGVSSASYSTNFFNRGIVNSGGFDTIRNAVPSSTFIPVGGNTYTISIGVENLNQAITSTTNHCKLDNEVFNGSKLLAYQL